MLGFGEIIAVFLSEKTAIDIGRYQQPPGFSAFRHANSAIRLCRIEAREAIAYSAVMAMVARASRKLIKTGFNMFKAIGNFLHRTPWWAMGLLGLSMLVLLAVFAAPIHVLRLQESGTTPEEKRAIKREIDRAFGDGALNVAENIVGVMKDRASDPARRAELEQALKEIAQARKDIFAAQRDAQNAAKGALKDAQEAAKEALKDAQDAAMEAARDGAQAAVEAATEAREAVEEAKRDAEDKLKSSGADTGAALKAFDDMIRSAKEKENAAREALKKITAGQKRGVTIGLNMGEPFKIDVDTNDPAKPGVSVSVDETGVKKKFTVPVPDVPVVPKAAPAPPKAGGPAGSPKFNGHIGIDDKGHVGINLPPLPALPPELRDDIRSKVANDMYRAGVGSAMVLAFIPIFIMLLIAKYLVGRSRRAQAFAEQKKQEADVSNVNRQVTEARLQALQAQVEPHFLYNTLANVQALTEVDPAAANQMTGHLIQYLRSSLPKMRENTSTVGQELELVRAYLNILRMRMGDRLAFDIDCPADLGNIAFPPMMLPSLVENAIKHGLEPLREGGRIDVVVTPVMTAQGQRIRIAVKDSGRGLSDAPTQAGGGLGLTNIRERLIAIYGDAGKLTLESNEPKGVVASIEVPAETGSIPTGNTTFAAGAARASTAKPAPKGWWGRTRHAISATHGVWAKVMSVTFITLMITLAVIFGLALAGLYTGMLPVHVGTARIDSIEGMALGTLALLVGFGAVALALVVVVAVLYGLGVLLAGLLVIIPLVVLIGVFPALAPFLLIGLAVYWFWRRKQRKNGELPTLDTSR